MSGRENPGSCAREGEHPPRPAQSGTPPLQEARYKRRGARHLFAGLSVADGQVYGTCRARKTFADFQTFVQQVIIPQALQRGMRTVHLILDNGTTHAPKQLEGWLQTLPVVVQGQLTFHVSWLPPNASWLDQIEIRFSLLQRKLLQPNHFVSVQGLEQAIADFLTYLGLRSFGLKHSLLITFKPGPGAEPFSLVGSCELAWEGTLSRRNNTAMLDA